MTLPFMTAAPSVVGAPVVRVDGPAKVTGAATYAADHQIPDVAYAVLVCSTVARGTVQRVATAAARKDRDVLKVLTEFSGVTLPFDPTKVAFFGQPVAVVVAATSEAAAHAATLVEVNYSGAAQLTDIDAPQAIGKPGKQPDYARGDADAALRSAPVVADLNHSIARNNHNPMELAATVASWTGDQLTVWDKVQGINSAQEAYAHAFGIAEEQVRVISPFVGGAFGSAGQTWPHQLLTAFAARQLGRPVKLMLTRKQMYSGIGYRPTSRQRLAIGADRAGRITAMIHEGHTESARYATYEDSITEVPRFLYACPNMRSVYRVVPLDVNLPTYMRGPGATTGTFALESTMDELAHRLGLDPVELRLRNEPAVDQTTGMPFSTRRLPDCLRQGAATFGWAQRNPVPRTRPRRRSTRRDGRRGGRLPHVAQ